jgi:hypothetical protein
MAATAATAVSERSSLLGEAALWEAADDRDDDGTGM